ncbi:MAG: UDP-3-O-[3-hydroxymyristoyl] N-acetylglucosamine deacetylase [Acidobacteria bacterium]|nr:MAG: UDP-3-O-[3-hydroxymyristoyl] N-acetylglucosamine deacetylase [Acidobacteriota bacterium]
MPNQRTLEGVVRLKGRGLHSGRAVELTIRPAGPGEGIAFVREDRGTVIPALQQYRAPMRNATRLERDGITVDTPEHLLAALYALGIDNARLHLDGPEVPILDGSAMPFVSALLDVGVAEQEAARSVLVVDRPVSIRDEDRALEVHPCERLRITAAIDFEHRYLGYQELTVELDDPADFVHKLAAARTFALESEVRKLRAAGLARGGSLDNAVVVGENGPMGGLRFADEFVRHKLLDLVGDMALLGCRLRARVVAWRSGHATHGRLVDAILAHPRAWHMEPIGGPPHPPARPTAPGRARA